MKKSGAPLTFCREPGRRGNELTMDNEQLTIMVSLRDGFENFLICFQRKHFHCQLSIVNANQELKAALVCKIETLMGLG